MPRYKLTIEYDGTPYIGWQAQDSGASVQGVLTDAIAAFAGERVTVAGAGRTDSGGFRRALLGDQAPLPLSHHQSPRRSDAGAEPRLACPTSARLRGHARR